MARDEDLRSRRRREEREEEEAKASALEKPNPRLGGSGVGAAIDSHQLAELLARAEPMIEQLNNLYNMYVAGVEKRPPLEKRSQLDALVASLQNLHKPTAAQQFRWTTFYNHYLTHRDRWTKLLKDLEDGKIKRRT